MSRAPARQTVGGGAWQALALTLVLVAGCGDDERDANASSSGGPPPPTGCAPGERLVEGPGCVAAGVQDDGCPAGEALVAGACVRAGPTLCGEGFVSVEGGCEPTLPPAACGPGEMAVPGDAGCREVAPCGGGPWGDIPIDGSTQFVDAAAPAGGDGSMSSPWRAVQDAIDAAEEGAIVAVTDGSYQEDVVIGAKAVRLWGRCPSRVELVGSASEFAALQIEAGASGTEVRGLAIRGGSSGVFVSGSEDVLLERTWIHDTGDWAVNVAYFYGKTSVTLRGALIESAYEISAFVGGARLTLDASVVRRTLGEGTGLVSLAADGVPTELHVLRSVIEAHAQGGVAVQGGSAVLDSSVVRDSADAVPLAGFGVASSVDDDTGMRGSLIVRSSMIEKVQLGVLVRGADALLEDTVVRDMLPADHSAGVNVESDPAGERASVTLRRSTIDRANGVGVVFGDSDGTVESTLIRDTRPDSAGFLGYGVSIQLGTALARSVVTVRGSSIQQSARTGILVSGSDAHIEGTAILDTAAGPGASGFGVVVQVEPSNDSPSTATLHALRLERNVGVGIAVAGSDAGMSATLVTDTAPAPANGFGDAVVAVATRAYLAGGVLPASLRLTSSRLERSGRAGVGAFSAAVTVGGTAFECNAIDLDGEVIGTSGVPPFAFEDQGGNACGCGADQRKCIVKSAGLTPPEPLAPSQ